MIRKGDKLVSCMKWPEFQNLPEMPGLDPVHHFVVVDHHGCRLPGYITLSNKHLEDMAFSLQVSMSLHKRYYCWVYWRRVAGQVIIFSTDVDTYTLDAHATYHKVLVSAQSLSQPKVPKRLQVPQSVSLYPMPRLSMPSLWAANRNLIADLDYVRLAVNPSYLSQIKLYFTGHGQGPVFFSGQ